MKTFKKNWSFIILLNTILCFAQTKNISMVTDEKISAKNDDRITLLLKMKNETSKEQKFQLNANVPKAVKILSTNTIITLEPNEELYYPFKLWVEKSQPAGEFNINITAIDSLGIKKAEANTELKIQPIRLLKLIATQPYLLMEKIGDSLKVSAQVFNSGNQTEKVNVLASFPQGRGNSTTLKKEITLQPFENKIVSFNKVIDKEIINIELFTVNIAAFDSNNEYFGNAMIMVQNALGDRRYVDPLNINQRLFQKNPNYITWMASNPWSDFGSSNHLDLHTEANLNNTKIGLNINASYWPNNAEKIILQNSYLTLGKGPLELKLGNVNANGLEVSVLGRGLELNVLPLNNKKWSGSIGVAEKSFNLVDPFNAEMKRGYTAFAKSTLQINDKFTLNNEFIFDTDKEQNNIIFKNGLEWNNKNNTVHKFDISYGNSEINNHFNLEKSSLAVAWMYLKNWKNWSWSSNNFYSSKYYPGLKRGATMIEQRLARNFGKMSFYTSGSYNAYDPQELNPQYRFDNKTTRLKIEIGSSFSLTKKISANIFSQNWNENANIFLGNDFIKTNIIFNATTFSAAINYNINRSENRLNISTSQGWSHYKNRTNSSYINQWQANWFYKSLMISALYQKGNFMLYEGNNEGQLTKNTQKISGLAYYKWESPNKKTSLNFTTLATYNSNTGTTWSLNTGVDYRPFISTKIFANALFSRFENNFYGASNVYYQIGITQEIPTIGEETVQYKNGTLKIFTFLDINHNNKFDEGIDLPAPNSKIKVNNTIFISDKDGNVKYRKLPYGEYTIRSLETKWYSEDQKIKLDKKEMFLLIPLQHSGVVRGKVIYQKTTKTQYEVLEIFAGIPIQFINTNGKIYTTYLNTRGEYIMYLPLGVYQVSIDKQYLQKNVYIDDNLMTVEVEEGSDNSLKDFLLKVKEKKLEVKRFGTGN